MEAAEIGGWGGGEKSAENPEKSHFALVTYPANALEPGPNPL